MNGLMLFYATHPFWVWLAVAAIFLAVEVATGTGWLLWPAASAAVVGLLTLVVAPGLAVEVGLFAMLTIASTYLARRFLRPVLDGPPHIDLNDPTLRLIGRDCEVLETFQNGKGRVFADGKEWAAVIREGQPPSAGQKVMVVAIDGAVLTVR
uniref:NfeD-like C-terminal domain-containing protein n=1 Tax=Caulobacter sp. (strain K31) TaxID=366602 RepID=B0T050_CAUSK